MAILSTIGSSSAGNGYILDCDGEKLIIELGCKWKDYLKALEYDVLNIVGVLCSHKHLDHISDITYKRCLSIGIPIYSCQEVCDKFEKVKLIEPKKKYQIGNFLVQAISVDHSCECYSYIIEHSSFGKLLFATDLTEFPYKIKGLNHIFIEANNDEEVMIDNFINGSYSRSASNTHLSIQKTIEILKANYGTSLQTVLLLHLSDNNSDERKFITMVKKELGFDNVLAAKSSLKIELKKEDF